MLFIDMYHEAVVQKKVFEAQIAIFTVKDYTYDDVILDDIFVIFLVN